MSKKKIVITGANGQLGKELQVSAASYPEFDFIFLSKDDLAIQEKESVKNFFYQNNPDYLINCAAYTAVDKAETDQEQAFIINAEAAGILASVCKIYGSKLIHISTDYVFDGNSAVPLKEDHHTSPVNIYGASKLLGEELVIQNNFDSIIIRTSWVYSEFGNNFVKTMIRLMRDKESINVINDQHGSPTYASDLAGTILEIIFRGHFISGIYNYSNEGEITWYDFAVAIKELTGAVCMVNAIPTTQYPTPAKRPQYSLLDKTKIKAVYQISIPEWKESLKNCLRKMGLTN